MAKTNTHYSETSIFRSTQMFSRELTMIINVLSSDIKREFGYNIVSQTADLMNLVRKCYNSKDSNTKFQYITEFLDTIEWIEMITKFLLDANFMKPKQAARISKCIGDTKIQANSWKAALEHKISGSYNTDC